MYGAEFGYFPNVSTTHLVVKEQFVKRQGRCLPALVLASQPRVGNTFVQLLAPSPLLKSISSLLQPLEDNIHQEFIPALTGHPACSREKQDFFTLPVRLGGLGI